jgi:hypothetical protein
MITRAWSCLQVPRVPEVLTGRGAQKSQPIEVVTYYSTYSTYMFVKDMKYTEVVWDMVGGVWVVLGPDGDLGYREYSRVLDAYMYA